MINCFIGVGNLVRDIEINEKSGVKFVHNALAIARDFTNKKTGKVETDFIPFKAFGKCAEYLSKYAKKGMKISIQGRWEHETYTTKDGKKNVTDSVNVSSVYILGRGENLKDSNEESKETPVVETSNLTEFDMDDMPF